MPEADRTRQLIDRFRRLPVRARDVWQGGIVRLPAWIDPKDGTEPWRPYAAFWVSLSTSRIDVRLEQAPGSHGPELLLAGLLQFARDEAKETHGRAALLQVADAGERDYLQRTLADADVRVEQALRLDAFDEARREYARLVKEDSDLPPSMLDTRGVTVDVVRDFADAAARYYAAAPWQYLSDEDLIEIESPAPPSGYRFALVLGNGGHTFGLAFYQSPHQHEAMRSGVAPDALRDVMSVARSIVFDRADGIPFDDHDLWLDHDLPLADPCAYPFAAHYGGRHDCERPGRVELEFAAAVLRALVDTTEDEMDSARWTKAVVAGGRPVRVSLSLPGLLQPGKPGERADLASRRRSFERTHVEIRRFLEEHQFDSMEEANAAIEEHFAGRSIDEMPSTASTPAERAQELAYQASDWVGRKRVVLAKQALALWPDCAEAYIILAEQSPTDERALRLYERAVEAGRRALGDEFDALAGEMWNYVEARPYMRAKMGLADLLIDLGRPAEAIVHYQDLLRLNANDNQGVRDVLVPLLLRHGRLDEAAAVLEKYRDDAHATMSYCAALLAFIKEGDSETSRASLSAALSRNDYVPDFLPDLPVDLGADHYQLGSEDEAIVVAEETGLAWKQTPGAFEWLGRTTAILRSEKRAAARREAKKGKAKKGRR